MRSVWMRSVRKCALLFVAVGFISSSALAQVVGTVRVVPTYLTSEADNGLKMDMSSFPVTVGLFTNRFALHATFPYVQLHAEVPVTYVGGRSGDRSSTRTVPATSSSRRASRSSRAG